MKAFLESAEQQGMCLWMSPPHFIIFLSGAAVRDGLRNSPEPRRRNEGQRITRCRLHPAQWHSWSFVPRGISSWTLWRLMGDKTFCHEARGSRAIRVDREEGFIWMLMCSVSLRHSRTIYLQVSGFRASPTSTGPLCERLEYFYHQFIKIEELTIAAKMTNNSTNQLLLFDERDYFWRNIFICLTSR